MGGPFYGLGYLAKENAFFPAHRYTNAHADKNTFADGHTKSNTYTNADDDTNTEAEGHRRG